LQDNRVTSLIIWKLQTYGIPSPQTHRTPKFSRSAMACEFQGFYFEFFIAIRQFLFYFLVYRLFELKLLVLLFIIL